MRAIHNRRGSNNETILSTFLWGLLLQTALDNHTVVLGFHMLSNPGVPIFAKLAFCSVGLVSWSNYGCWVLYDLMGSFHS